MDDKQFDRIADAELKALESALGQIDPDEVEVENAQGVLTLTLPGEQAIVINSHRAAGQIWMAAFRRAWHFTPREEGGGWAWRTERDELRATLRGILREKLGHDVAL